MYSRVNQYIKNEKIIEAIIQLKLIANSIKKGVTVAVDMPFDINLIIKNINAFNLEDIKVENVTKSVMQKRLTLFIDLILECEEHLLALTPASWICILVNASIADRIRLVEYIIFNKPWIFTKHPEIFTDIVTAKEECVTLKEFPNVDATAEQMFYKHHIEAYAKLCELLKSIEQSVPYDEPISDDQAKIKIIAKMFMAYILVHEIVVRTRYTHKEPIGNIKERMQQYLYPFADILLYLLENNERVNDLSKPVLVAYHDQYKRYQSLAFSLMSQLCEIGVAYANYSHHDHDLLPGKDKDIVKATHNISSLAAQHKGGIIPIKSLIDLNRQSEAACHLINIKYNDQNKIYMFPKKRVAINNGYIRGNDSKQKISIDKIKTGSKMKYLAITHDIQPDLMHTFSCTLVNRIFIVRTLLGDDHEYNGFRIQASEANQSSEENKDIRNTNLTLDIDDYLRALEIAQSLLVSSAKLYNVTKKITSTIAIIDPLYFQIMEILAKTLRTMLININGFERAHHPCIQLLEKLSDNVDLYTSYSQDAIDFDKQDQFNIDKIFPHWTEKFNELMAYLLKYLKEHRGQSLDIPYGTINELDKLVEQFYQFRDLNSTAIFASLKNVKIETTKHDVTIQFYSKATEDYQFFVEACKLTLAKHSDQTYATIIAMSSDIGSRSVTIHNFREREKQLLLKEIINEFDRLILQNQTKNVTKTANLKSEPTIADLKPFNINNNNERQVEAIEQTDEIEEEPQLRKRGKPKSETKKQKEEEIAKKIADRKQDKEEKAAARKHEKEQAKNNALKKVKNNSKPDALKIPEQKMEVEEIEDEVNLAVTMQAKGEIEVVVHNPNDLIFTKSEKFKFIYMPQNLDLKTVYHYYHQIVQQLNACIDNDEHHFNDERSKYFFYYNCLRLLDHLKTSNFIQSKELLKRVREIRNLLAHRADLILHSDKYDKCLASASAYSFAILCCRIYELCVNAEAGMLHRTEQDIEEARISQLIYDNPLCIRFYVDVYTTKHKSDYTIKDIISTIEYIYQLLHTKDNLYLNAHPAIVLEVNPILRDVIKMHLFELGLMIVQFNHHPVIKWILTLTTADLSDSSNLTPYLDIFREKFKEKLSSQEFLSKLLGDNNTEDEMRTNILLHLLWDMRNFIAHDHEQENVDYPEEFDTHFIYDVCDALHSQLQYLKKLILEWGEEEKVKLAKQYASPKQVAESDVFDQQSQIHNTQMSSNGSPNNNNSMRSNLLFKPMNPNAPAFKPTSMSATALAFVPRLSINNNILITIVSQDEAIATFIENQNIISQEKDNESESTDNTPSKGTKNNPKFG